MPVTRGHYGTQQVGTPVQGPAYTATLTSSLCGTPRDAATAPSPRAPSASITVPFLRSAHSSAAE